MNNKKQNLAENDWTDLNTFRKANKRKGGIFITISSQRWISLSSDFLHAAKENISINTYAILSFSKSRNAIVFRFDSGESLGALKMSVRGNNLIISAKSFFKYYKIDAEKYAGRHNPSLENISGIGYEWVIFLDRIGD